MLQLTQHLPRGAQPESGDNSGDKSSKETRTQGVLNITLPFELRSKSRLRVTLSSGVDAALLLPRGTVLRGGDAVLAADGTRVAVHAALEAVLYITAPNLQTQAQTQAQIHVETRAQTLLQAAYHLGNRHTPVEVGANYLAIAADPVLADMLEQLGAVVQPAMRAFEPEHGAYSSSGGGQKQGHTHGHDETFAEDYALAQASFAHHHAGAEHDHKQGHDGQDGHAHHSH